MKRLSLSLLLGVSLLAAKAQNQSVSIGTEILNPKAVLWLKGTGSQGLLLPVVTTASRNVMGLTAAEEGMTVFDTDTKQVLFWTGTEWRQIGGTGGPAEVDGVIGNEVTQVGTTGGLELSTVNNNLTVSLIPGTADGQVLRWNQTDQRWELGTSAAGGEVNTASNVGAGGVGTFRQKTGVNLEFKNINAASNRVAVTNDAVNNEVDIDVNQANLSIAASQLTGTISSAQITDATITGTDLAGNIAISTSGNLATTGTFSATGTTATLNPTGSLTLRGATWPAANAAGALINNGSGTLTWSTVMTNPMTTLGDFIVGGAAGTPTRLAGATAGSQYLRRNAANSAYEFATLSVGSTEITDNSIVNVDVNASAAIAGTKISPNFGAQNILTTGNVGINTGTPSERLDVVGNVRFSGALMPNNLPGTAGQVLTSQGAGSPPVWSNGAGWGLTGNAATNPATNFVGTTDAQDLTFRTNNSERLRITQTGNVGIGINAPTSLLDVRGGENSSIDLATTGLGIRLRSAVNSVNGAEFGTTTGHRINFLTSNSPRMTISASGNVGIGTNNPSYKLTISDPASAGIRIENTSTTMIWDILNDANSLKFVKIPGSTFTALTLTQEGAIGIYDGVGGTTFGTAGQVLTSQGAGVPPAWTNAAAGWGLNGNTGTTAGTDFVGTRDAQDLVFKTNDVETARITTTGRLGIGTTLPDMNLEIVSSVTPTIRLKNAATTGLGDSFIEFGHDNGSGGFERSGMIGDPGSGDYLEISSPNNVIFNTNFNQRMSISSTGIVEMASQVAGNPVLSVMNMTGTWPGVSLPATLGSRIFSLSNTAQVAGLETRAAGTGGGDYMGIFAVAEGTTGLNRGAVISALGSSQNTGLDVFADGNSGLNIGGAITVGGTQTDDKFGLMINASGNGTKTGLQVTGENRNSFSGNVGIGTVAPTSKLEVVGDVKIPAANNYTYAAPKTKTLSVSHAAFQLATTNPLVFAHRSLNSGNPSLLRTTGGTTGTPVFFEAPVYLPDGATVTALTAYLFDNTATYLASVRLVVQPLGSITPATMATVDTGPAAGNTAIGVFTPIPTTASISPAVIDNSTNSYFLVFETTENNTNLGLYNVAITYQISNVD